MMLAVANRVSTSKLICATPMPNSRGIISCATLRIPGCENETPKLNFIPLCTSCGTCIRNCKTPPTSTPAASDIAGLLKYFHTAAIEKMIDATFQKMGVAAGSPNT